MASPSPGAAARSVPSARSDGPAPSRFPPPPRRPGLIERPGLVARLDAARGLPLVVLAAPAGSGKTSALVQWAASLDRPLAWIDAVDAHQDPSVLLHDVFGALREVAPDLRGPLADIEPGPGADLLIRVLPQLARVLRGTGSEFVVVLDGLHVLTDPQCVEVLATVAENIPEGCQLVLGARSLPPGLSGLRARQVAIALGPAELAVTEAEAAAMLAAAGVTLDDAQVARLVAHVEGWPAGVALAALIVRGSADPEAAFAAFAGDDRRIADYFSEEVLRWLPEGSADLLMDTSVLDVLTAPACSAVRGAEVTPAALAALEREHSFVMTLDGAGERFRVHRLFAEMLRAELRRRDPARFRALSARAAQWSVERGDAPAAVRHLRDAGRDEAAALVVWRSAMPLQTNGRVATLRMMIDGFGPERVRGLPALALASAWSAVPVESEAVGHWIRVAGALLDEAPPSPETDEMRANLLLLRAMVGADGATAMRADADSAYQAYPEASPWRGLACLFGGIASSLLGDQEEGRRRLEEGVERLGDDAPSVSMVCLTWLAVAALVEDSARTATGFATRARGLVDRARLADYTTTALLDAVEALLSARAGDASASWALLQRSRTKLTRTEHVAPWFQLMARMLLARAALQSGRDDTARTLAEEAAAFPPRIPDSPLLDAEYAAFRHAMDGVPSGAVFGPGSLTSAELRVVRFLPTHLTYKEIGQRLHVSRFTIKSQVQAAYRKLGVTTRSDAVARAHALGLLDQ